MLTPILATDDPYEAAGVFVDAGWSLVFQTPPDSDDPLTVVGLADTRLMLGTSLPQFLPAESRPHKGAGVEFHLTVPENDIGTIFDAHRKRADSVTDLVTQPWGELAFHAVVLGYKFLIAAEASGPSPAAPSPAAPSPAPPPPRRRSFRPAGKMRLRRLSRTE